MPKYTLPPTLRQILSTPSQTAADTFDPWNSVSTGHQRAEGRSVSHSSGWRGIRNRQITGQFGGGRGGSVEVGWRVERDKDDGIKEREGKRRKLGTGAGNGDRDIRSLLGRVTKSGDGDIVSGGLKRKPLHEEDEGVITGGKKIRIQDESEGGQLVPELIVQKGGGALCFDNDYNDDKKDDKDHDHDHDYDDDCTYDAIKTLIEGEEEAEAEAEAEAEKEKEKEKEKEDDDTKPTQTNTKNGTNTPKQIFAHLSIYINGSTMPTISDHKLKHLLASHGANLSMDLARRRITHVILGCPAANTKANAKGAGGGLAGGKLQREIQRVGGKGVKFVGVQWVLESIKAGRRLPEARFADLHMASSKQRSVFDDFRVQPVSS